LYAGPAFSMRIDRAPKTWFWEENPMQSPVAVAALKRISNLRLRWSEDGQDLLEYGLLMALIAIFAMGAVASVGQMINGVFWDAIAASF
jgi:Flp pilus assembly pilin Flp